MNTTTMAMSDTDAIKAVVNHYVDGAKSGKGADMKPAFHQDATIFGYAGPDLFAGPIQGLYDWNEENWPAPDIKVLDTQIDIADTVATVRLELDNWTGHRFTDLFTLLNEGIQRSRFALVLISPTPSVGVRGP